MSSVNDVISEIVDALGSLVEAESTLAAARQSLDAGRELLRATAQGTPSPLLIAALEALDDADSRLANAEVRNHETREWLLQYLEALGATAERTRSIPRPRPPTEDGAKPKAPPVSIHSLRPLHPRPAGDNEHPVADWAVDCALNICVDGWQHTVANQLASVLTAEAWQTCREDDAADCARLAAAAQAVQDALDLPFEFVEAQVEICLADSGFSSGVAKLLAATFGRLLKLAKRPLDQPMLEVIRAIRVLGVAICAVQGTLDTCPCLDALVRNLIGDVVRDLALKELLRPGLVAGGQLR